MMTLTGRRLTLDEFLALPEESPGLEYLDGRVVRKVSPKAYHGATQYALTERVNLYGRPRRLARAFPETRATFGGWSPVPDVGVYRWENLPRRADGKLLREFQTPWDIVVEIVSPDQSRADLKAKCRWYCANGVEISLMIDPDREDVICFGADGSRVELRNEDRIDLDSVLPGLHLTPDDLFSELYAD
ncbi:MAG: Uma2 family endonuclease [Chloroflexi bacterium]|nr:Uma2 family endonuclease [Chloroflexota bacterium]